MTNKIINKVEIIHNRNCVYQTAYHVIWCPKYGKQVLIGDIACAVSDILDALCAKNNWTLITKEVQADHIHLFLSIPPAIAVASAVKTLKGTSALKLFVQFPELKKQLSGGHLWAPSYFVGTAGNVNAETIRQYIELSEHIKGRR